MTQTPGGEPPAVEGGGLPARTDDDQQVAAPVVRRGMFGVHDTPDTSGYGLLQVRKQPPVSSEPPYGRGVGSGGAPRTCRRP